MVEKGAGSQCWRNTAENMRAMQWEAGMLGNLDDKVPAGVLAI